MPRPTRWNLSRIRRRQAGYRHLLAAELLILALQPLCFHWPLLNPLLAILLASLILATLTRFSMLRSSRLRAAALGMMAIVLELAWIVLASLSVTMPLWINLLHLGVWLAYLGLTVLRVIKTLIQEPYVTISVVMGAASGYLLIGYSGGLLLYSLWLLYPDSFSLLIGASGHSTSALSLLSSFPSLLLGAFGFLTTAGTNLVQTRSLAAEAATTLITVTGQLYVAILIALVLSRYHRRRF
ncbi:MAG: hypothetical protein VKI83_01245 [Synechococcaceae cyanobacterium]|nr:hypothetical protein [Synechococcaceae cyanobacterium]